MYITKIYSAQNFSVSANIDHNRGTKQKNVQGKLFG